MVSIHRRIIDIKKKTKKPKRKYLFQGQSAISDHWFNLDIERAEENFSTREPHF